MNIMIKIIRTMFFLILVFALTACGREEIPTETSVNDTIQTEESPDFIRVIDNLLLSPEEEAYIQSIKDSGVLKVATTVAKGNYQVIDGEIRGYNYAAIKHLADDLSVTLDVRVVSGLKDYFSYNDLFDPQVQTDPSIIYSPDLLEEVDIYIDILTPLPWREKLVDIVAFLPVREVIVHAKGIDIQSPKDLNGLTVALNPVSSYNHTLEETVLKHNLTLNYRYTKKTSQALELISEGQADFTIMDSNWAFLEIESNDALAIGQPLTNIQHIGWAVKKDNDILKSILEKYWDGLKSSGQFNHYWLEDYKVNYYDYYRLISKDLSAMETILFSAEERAYIQQLKDRGVLKIALQESEVCFNIVDGEHKGFNYLLAQNLAHSLGIELDARIVGDFTTYFWKDGQTPPEIKTDPTFTYVPDVLNEVDIYTDNITHLPWRKQIFNQISIVPAKAVFVLHKEAKIDTVEDLNGKTIAINRDTSFEVILQELIEKHDLSVTILDITNDRQGYDAVNNKEADATMIDSDLGLLILQDYNNLVISFSASDISNIGWAVKKEDDILASILSKYIDGTKQNGKFEAYWLKTYDFSYIEYLRLLTD